MRLCLKENFLSATSDIEVKIENNELKTAIESRNSPYEERLDTMEELMAQLLQAK